jgi:predicted transcriptional regulator
MQLHNFMQMGNIMKRFTISVQDDLKKELDSLADINWAEVARKGIEDKLKQLEKFEVLEKSGEL